MEWTEGETGAAVPLESEEDRGPGDDGARVATVRCPLCSQWVYDTPGRRGRGREVHATCRRAYHGLSDFDVWMSKIGARLPEDSRNKLRSRLWGLANQLNERKGR